MILMILNGDGGCSYSTGDDNDFMMMMIMSIDNEYFESSS